MPVGEYELCLRDPLLNLFLRLQADRSASVKVALGGAVSDLLAARIETCMNSTTSFSSPVALRS